MKPEQELELPESVARAFASLREVPPPDAERWAARRAAFLQQAQNERPAAVTFAPSARHKEQESPKRGFKLWFAKEGNLMVTALKLMLIFSLMFGTSAGTVSASQNSVPGDPLYGVKLAWEQAQLNLATKPEAKVERLLTMAQTRLQEAEKLAAAGKDVPTALAQRYQAHVQEAERLIGTCEEPVRQQLMDRLQTRLAEHEQTMTQLAERVQTRAQSEAALQQMLQTQQQVRERLQQQWQDGTPGQQGPAGPGPNPTGTPQGPNGPNPGGGGGQQGPAGPGPNPTSTPQGPNGPNPGGSDGQQGPAGPGPNPTSTPQGPNGPGPNPGGSGQEPSPTCTPTGGQQGPGPNPNPGGSGSGRP